MYKIKTNRRIFHSKLLILSLIFSFVLLVTKEATPRKINLNSSEEFKPVVKVRETQEQISESQKKLFNRLIDDGKKLLQEKMDYEGAINKFKEAKTLAVTREQKTDALFYLSLAHYAILEEKGDEEFNETIRKLIETDYYRELDELLCPPRYVQLFREIKKDYGALRVQSKPPGADVYIDESKEAVGKTPLTIGAKAGAVKIRVKKGKQEKKDTLRVAAGKETKSPTYVLKGRSSLIYVIGGIVLAGGVGAALLGGGKGNGGGTPTPSPGPTTGSIQVNSNPTGAQVFLDGNDTGKTTNTTLTDVSPGTHAVKLVKEGYLDYEENVSVTAGQTASVDATLTEIEEEGGYVFITKWGDYGAGNGQFNDPQKISIDGAGFVYVVDTSNYRIQKFTSEGTFVAKWGTQGTGDGQFNEPLGIAIDGGGFVYVADGENHRIQKFTSDGTFVAKWGAYGEGDSQFDYPSGVAVDVNGFVYVLDTYNYQIKKFNSDGTFVAKWGDYGAGDGQFNDAQDICIDGAGSVYVLDTRNYRIQKFASDRTFVTKWGILGTGNGQFNEPYGIATDSSGNIYVADTYNQRIQKFTSDGTYVTKWGSNGEGDGQFDYPYGLAVDASGYVYVADAYNQRIQKFGPSSAVQKITEKTYSSLNNRSLNRNLRPRPGFFSSPGLKGLKMKQKLMDKKVKRNRRRDGK